MQNGSHGVTLASPTPASDGAVVSAVSSEITVVSSTTVVSITAVDSLVNPTEEATGADVSGGVGADVSTVVVSGESSVEVDVSPGAEDAASVVVAVGVGSSEVSGVTGKVEDVSAGAMVSSSCEDVAVVGFTGGGVGVVVPPLSVSTDTTDASASWARASSQALLSFSQPKASAKALTQTADVAAPVTTLRTQPGLRPDLACRGSFVFVIVSRYPQYAPITTPATTQLVAKNLTRG